MAKSGTEKEDTKIRRSLNRQRRRIIKTVLKKTQDDCEIPAFKKTEGWESF